MAIFHVYTNGNDTARRRITGNRPFWPGYCGGAIDYIATLKRNGFNFHQHIIRATDRQRHIAIVQNVRFPGLKIDGGFHDIHRLLPLVVVPKCRRRAPYGSPAAGFAYKPSAYTLIPQRQHA
jgi:hypothetical protein